MEPVVNKNERFKKNQEKLAVKVKDILAKEKVLPKDVENLKKLLGKESVKILDMSTIEKHMKFETNLEWKKNKGLSSEAEMKTLMGVVSENDNIEELNFSKMKITNAGVKHLCAALEKNKTVKRLYVERNSFTDLTPFGSLLEKSSTIEEISFSMNNVKDEGVAKLAEGLEKNKNSGLRVLVLFNCNFTSKGAVEICKVLAGLSKIEEVNMGLNKVGDEEGMKAIGSMVENSKSLKILHLSKIPTKEKGEVPIQILMESLAKNEILTDIRLNANNISDEGAKSIGKMLKVNKKLEVLRLSFNDQITDEGVREICEGLKLNLTLLHLKMLYLNAMTEKGFEYLTNTIENHDTVKELGMSGGDPKETYNLGIKAIAKLLEKNQMLEKLELGQLNDYGATLLIGGLEKNSSIVSVAVEGRSNLNKENRKKIQEIIKKRNKNFVF